MKIQFSTLPLRVVSVFAFIIGLTGCSSSSKNAKLAEKQRIQFETRITNLKVKNRELKQQNQLLSSILEKRKKQNVSVLDAFEKAGSVPAPTSGSAFGDPKSQEYFLYTECLKYFERKDFQKFESNARKLLTSFPQGENSDSVLLMAGQIALTQKKYQQAIQYFSTIAKEFPLSARVPTAILMKAQTYKTMNLVDPARDLYAQVKTRYPGTQEALQADSALKNMTGAEKLSDSNSTKGTIR